jgi:hypothetical protein
LLPIGPTRQPRPIAPKENPRQTVTQQERRDRDTNGPIDLPRSHYGGNDERNSGNTGDHG